MNNSFSKKDLDRYIQYMINMTGELNEKTKKLDHAVDEEICKLRKDMLNKIYDTIDIFERDKIFKYKLYRLLYNPENETFMVLSYKQNMISSMIDEIQQKYDVEIDFAPSRLIPNDGNIVILPLGVYPSLSYCRKMLDNGDKNE